MNEVGLFKNEELGLQVRTILNEDGSISINAEDTAFGFGWAKTETKNGKQYTSIRWATMNGYLAELGFRQQVGENDYIPETLFYLLGMKANNKAAQAFQMWIAADILPAVRKTGHYSHTHKTQAELILEQAKLMVEMERRQKENEEAIANVNQKVDGIKDIVALNSVGWREDVRKLIARIAHQRGGNEYIQEVNSEIYTALNSRLGVNLKQRRNNKRKRLAHEGASKANQNKVTYIDVIADDKKLIEGYVAIVKEMAIKYGVADDKVDVA